jgi:hypothetical protein
MSPYQSKQIENVTFKGHKVSKGVIVPRKVTIYPVAADGVYPIKPKQSEEDLEIAVRSSYWRDRHDIK